MGWTSIKKRKKCLSEGFGLVMVMDKISRRFEVMIKEAD